MLCLILTMPFFRLSYIYLCSMVSFFGNRCSTILCYFLLTDSTLECPDWSAEQSFSRCSQHRIRLYYTASKVRKGIACEFDAVALISRCSSVCFGKNCTPLSLITLSRFCRDLKRKLDSHYWMEPWPFPCIRRSRGIQSNHSLPVQRCTFVEMVFPCGHLFL